MLKPGPRVDDNPGGLDERGIGQLGGRNSLNLVGSKSGRLGLVSSMRESLDGLRERKPVGLEERELGKGGKSEEWKKATFKYCREIALLNQPTPYGVLGWENAENAGQRHSHDAHSVQIPCRSAFAQIPRGFFGRRRRPAS